jgi:hypothetical protein
MQQCVFLLTAGLEWLKEIAILQSPFVLALPLPAGIVGGVV